MKNQGTINLMNRISTYIRNRRPTKPLDDFNKPYEVWTGSNADIFHLQKNRINVKYKYKK
uniref:Uncharacterized protein n=1 Tax=Megaselia scalaris TaxID=36166 RepID=T1GSS0_MEGSC